MKNILWGLMLVAGFANAAPFNHSAIQKGAISESCYRDPCSIGKVLSFRQIQKSPNQSMIELKVLGGTKSSSGRVSWNKKPHTVVVTCSKTAPSVAINGFEETLPLNPNGVPGAQENSAGLYLQACHAYKEGDSSAGAIKYGYNVQ